MDSTDLDLDSGSSSPDSGSNSNSPGFFQAGKLYEESHYGMTEYQGGGLLTSIWRYVVCEREFSNGGQIWIEGAGTQLSRTLAQLLYLAPGQQDYA